MIEATLLAAFESEVIKKLAGLAARTDEESRDLYHGNYVDLDWYAMTVGWALAKGLSPEAAIDFALHVRYHTDLA